jgi:hypothetical protein
LSIQIQPKNEKGTRGRLRQEVPGDFKGPEMKLSDGNWKSGEEVKST